jgi:hypothetical protein
MSFAPIAKQRMTRDSSPAHLAERWLAEAYELVSAGWCQGTACDADGNPCEPDAASAVRWSASGALACVWRRSGRHDEIGLHALQRANLALTAVVNDVPRIWNDAPERRQREVAEALLQAVTLANDPVLFGGRDGDGPAAGRLSRLDDVA